MTIVGTRPEIIRLSEVMKRLDEVSDHILVHTGQNFDYELNEVFFDDLKLRRPDIFLESSVAGQRPIQTIAKVLEKTDEALMQIKPDAVLVH